jgi:predicted nuclease of restriction endonuclease-like (RecB) superfamily
MAEKNSIPQFVNSESIMSDSNYVKWLSDLKGRIRIAQLKAAIKVNEELHKLYWSLGEDICNKQKLYKWGTNFIKQLSLDLRSAFPNVEGFSWSNLYKIRKWYLFYSSQNEFLYQAGTKLETLESTSVPMPAILLRVPWRHQTVIVSKCKTILEAMFYLNQVIEGNLSRNELEHIIEAHLYEQKGKALNNFESTLPAPQKALANEMLKDPYKLDFLSMAGDFSEKDLEDKLAQNITRFLLELGKGFAYVGRQMELTTPSGKSLYTI